MFSSTARNEYVASIRRRLDTQSIDLHLERITASDAHTIRLPEETAAGENPRQAVYAIGMLVEAPGYDIRALILSDEHGVFKAGKVTGNTGTLVGASVLAWGLGKLAGNHDVSHIGLDGESEAMLQILKYTVRRERPNPSSGYAFPSGHSADTFATATVIERHLSLKWSIVAYTVSSYVAMSRLHDNLHYLSDVVFGAALGTAAGSNVTRHGSTNFSVAPILVPRGGGSLFKCKPIEGFHD